MSDNSPFGFGKYVPGFDFLQNLAKSAGGGMPHLPNLSHWVAPTMNVQELEKRIEELKAVHFWLEQNARALAATVQALEVQKMTLATLQGMNFSLGDMAQAFKPKPAESPAAPLFKPAESIFAPKPERSAAPSPAPAPEPPPAPPADAPSGADAPAADAPRPAPAMASLIDPLQWWGALTQQFQQIATNAMKDAAQHGALDAGKHLATGLAQEAMKTAASSLRAVMPAGAASAGDTPRVAKKAAAPAVRSRAAGSATPRKGGAANASPSPAPGSAARKSAASPRPGATPAKPTTPARGRGAR